eukprot:1144812-Pelagomonas_calceolata.AAC.4
MKKGVFEGAAHKSKHKKAFLLLRKKGWHHMIYGCPIEKARADFVFCLDNLLCARIDLNLMHSPVQLDWHMLHA